MKICKQCTREFVPSSRHLKCPSCRKANAAKGKSFCLECGIPIWLYSTYCKLHVGLANKPKTVKGETRLTSKGYIRYYYPEHPRAHRGWIAEHVVVMENTIGRHLLPGENVHHKNGNRADNRSSNLELWVTFQPSGQRPEDLVEYAKEILARYGDDS